MKKPKIFAINIYFVPYHIPLLSLLNENFDITYLLVRKNPKLVKIKDVEKFKYKNFKPFSFGRVKIAFGVFWKLLFSKYDILISNDPHIFETIFGGYIAKIRGKKFILYSETWDWPRRILSKVLNLFLWILFRITDVVIVSSKKAAEYCYKLGYSRKKPYFIFSPPSLDFYDKNVNKKVLYRKLPEAKNKKIILYLNRIVPYKGLDYLVKALPRLKTKIHLIVCGSFDIVEKETRMKGFKEYVEGLIKKFNLRNISFLEYSEEMKKYCLNVCDVAVSPATLRDCDGESWGYMVLDAMSAKKPVIATDTTGCAEEIVKNGINGFVVPHGNLNESERVNELAKAIDKVLSDDKLTKKMGENGRKVFKTVNWERAFEEYKKAINYIMKN